MAGKKPTFKPYDQRQLLMLPPSLEDLIPKDYFFYIIGCISTIFVFAILVTMPKGKFIDRFFYRMQF